MRDNISLFIENGDTSSDLSDHDEVIMERGGGRTPQTCGIFPNHLAIKGEMNKAKINAVAAENARLIIARIDEDLVAVIKVVGFIAPAE
ncbi:MAG: hypothetical protein CMO47_11360 [Verrucomicrobiales bacterium]|nr:hypothetical protein [Verrucomicrobiales bacterium]